MHIKLINGKYVIIYLHVNDMLTFGTNYNIVYKTKYFLVSKFDIKYMDETNIILSVRIIRKMVV